MQCPRRLVLLCLFTAAIAVPVEAETLALSPNSDYEPSEHGFSLGMFSAWDAMDDDPADHDVTYIFNRAEGEPGAATTRTTVVGMQAFGDPTDTIHSLTCEALAGGNFLEGDGSNFARVAILLPDIDGVPQFAKWSSAEELSSSPLLTNYRPLSVTATTNLEGGSLTIEDALGAACGVETTAVRPVDPEILPNEARVTQMRLIVEFEPGSYY